MLKESYLKKYKPKFYKDFFIDKEYVDILNTLQNMDNLNILFIGDHGVGKTSIINATINEYYGIKNISSENILYINSLKEQGIQYYRNNLKTFCQTKSTCPFKKKFIVLDDIDMINEQSQQVFRNCIDKYSNNVNFLISCTNNQKVIDNIQSRTTIIKLKKISNKNIKKLFERVKNNENIKINKNAEKFLFNICNNSINKLLNNLEKFKIYNKTIDEKNIKNISTNISYTLFENYTKFWLDKDYKNSINILLTIQKKGYSVLDILDSYFSFIKITDIVDEEKKYKIIKYILKSIQIFYTNNENEIELAFFTNNLIINLC